MLKRIVCLAVLVVVVIGLSSVTHGQLLGLYEFDGGGDGTSWNDATNWEQVLDPDGNPISGNPATAPGPMTSADLPLSGVVIDSSMPGQTALDVSIGTANGAGSLSMSGGDLTVRDLNVGDDGNGVNSGTFNLSGGNLIAGDDISVGSGSSGMMTVSDGMASTSDDFNVSSDGTLIVTGGVVNVGDNLQTTGNASILVDGGTIIGNDDFRWDGDPQITITSGLMEVIDKLRFDELNPATTGKLTINGGVVRSQEYGLDGGSRGLIEINGDGVYQVDQSELSIAEAQMLIAAGVHLTTSELNPLVATSVVVPDFFGQPNLTFTQISVIPEPTSGLLLLLALCGLRMRRRRG